MIQLAVVDTETTGLLESDQVCELAIATLGTRPAEGEGTEFWMERAWGTFIKPTCTMSLGARATHHISDEDLAKAPTMTELLLRRGLPEFGHSPLPTAFESVPEPDPFRLPAPDKVIFVAHNADYDRKMLVQSGIYPDLLPKQTICTWKCAMHIWQDAESHKNQFLRYYLGLQPAFISDEPPHRAMADIAITAALVGRMLTNHTVDELVKLTQTPVIQKFIAFSKYRGSRWEDLDVGFLQWILRQTGFTDDVRYTAAHWLRQKTNMRR